MNDVALQEKALAHDPGLDKLTCWGLKDSNKKKYGWESLQEDMGCEEIGHF